jgi:hypothetical protein
MHRNLSHRFHDPSLYRRIGTDVNLASAGIKVPNLASVGFGSAGVERAEIKGLLTSRNNFVTRQTFNIEEHSHAETIRKLADSTGSV